MWVQMNPIPSIPTHVSCQFLPSTILQLQLTFIVHKLSSLGEMMRAIESLECPPGTEMSVTSPSSLSSSGSKSWGSFGWYSLLMCDCSGHRGPQPQSLLTWPSPSEAQGQQSQAVHLFPCSHPQ